MKHYQAYVVASCLALVALATVSAAPYSSPAYPGRVAGVVFLGSSLDTPTELLALSVDPHAKLVDSWWNGHVVFVVFTARDYTRKVTNSGAVWVFDAVAAGCHS